MEVPATVSPSSPVSNPTVALYYFSNLFAHLSPWSNPLSSQLSNLRISYLPGSLFDSQYLPVFSLPLLTCCPFFSCSARLINNSQVHTISSFFLLKQAQLFSLSLLVLLHSPQNTSFTHAFLVSSLPSQAAPAPCPRLPASAI